jgi:hypothetical protein
MHPYYIAVYTIIMDLDFNKNEDNMKQALSQLRNRFQKIAVGGGLKSIRIPHFMRLVHLPVMKCMKNMGGALPAAQLPGLDMLAGGNVLFLQMTRR